MFSFFNWFTPKVSAEKTTQDILSKTSRLSPTEFEHLAEKSELSNPDIHIVPYGFYKSHYMLLDIISYYSGLGNPEFTHEKMKDFTKSGDKRASELGRMGFLNVRAEKFPLPQGGTGKRNYYSINKKGREALINFNHKF